MVESRMAVVPALVEQMRREDREFITAETVAMFSQCSRPEAAVALSRLGFAPEAIGPVDERGELGVAVIDGDRVFAVIPGRRWTKVPEYLSNGQLTARFFVDEAQGIVRDAAGWSKPGRWLPAEGAAWVLGLIEQWRESVARGERLLAGIRD